MSEVCPLFKNVPLWLESNGEIEICTLQCEPQMDNAFRTQVSIYDGFGDNCGENADEPCGHDIEFGGSQIEHLGGRLRAYTILNSCMQYGTDLSNETVHFECPYASQTD